MGELLKVAAALAVVLALLGLALVAAVKVLVFSTDAFGDWVGEVLLGLEPRRPRSG